MGRFYDRRVWRRMSRLQLQREPFCRHCRARGLTVLATQADHVHAIELGGDPHGELESLCDACHAVKTRSERGSSKARVRTAFDRDGNPLDRNHHWNRRSGS